MGDINLLPEDLRDRELAARKAAANGSNGPEFSHPREQAHTPAEGSAPGRWQQLMSALKKNVSAQPTSYQSQIIKAPPTPLPKANIPVNQPAVSAMPPTKASPSPAISPVVKAQPKSFSVSQRPVTSQPANPILDVNLLPAQEGKPISRQTISGMVFMVIGAILVVAVAYFSLRILVNRRTAETDAIQQEVIELQQQLEASRAAAENAIATQSRIKVLADLLKVQGHWQGFFSFLEKNTIPVVQLTTLAADANGKVTVGGVAPNFTEVGRQMLAYQQSKDVTQVKLSSITIENSRDNTGNSSQVAKFSFSLTLVPELFVSP